MGYENLKLYLIVLFFYALLTTLLTYPIILHIDDGLTTGFGDPALNTWTLAWNARTILADPLNLFNANIFYPFNKNSLALSEHLFANNLISLPIIGVTHNPILAYNVIFLLSFILSGFGMFLLVLHYTNDKYSAFLAGTAFAFCSFRFSHIGQLQLLTIQWTPLALLYLDKFLWKSSSRNAMLFASFLILQILSSWYLAVYVTIITVAYMFYMFWKYDVIRQNIFNHAFQFKVFLFLLAITIIIAPFSLPYIQLSHEYGFLRSLSESEYYSADVVDYFATSQNNVLYSFYLWRPIQEHRNLVDCPLFPGLVVVALSLYAIFKINGYDIPCYRYNKINFYFIIALFAFLLSLGPFLHFFGYDTNMPLPYKYLYEHLPIFKSIRVPLRFSIIIALSLSILAGYGLKILTDTLNNSQKSMLSFLLIIILIVESVHVPLSVSIIEIDEKIPDVYNWLGQTEEDFVIVELPTNSLYYDTEYMYFSTFHWKKLVNGYSGFSAPGYPELLYYLQYFPTDKSISELEQRNVKYVIIHSSKLEVKKWNEIKTNLTKYESRINLVNVFEDDYVYQLLKSSSPSAYLTKHWHGFEVWGDTPTQWMSNDATLTIYSDENRTATLSFNALSFHHSRTLEIYVNDFMHMRAEVPSESFVTVNVPVVCLNKSVNHVRFHVLEGCVMPCDIPELKNNDSRCLSLAVQNITLIKGGFRKT